MKRLKRFLTSAAAIALVAAPAMAAERALRPPAVPLVTFDPYLSIWSENDTLNGGVTRHWTHHPQSLVSLIRVDGKAYRLMGNEPKEVPPLEQKGVEVLPTRSIYQFGNAQVNVTMTFTTTALPDDLDALARPLSYITWDVRSADGAKHEVAIYDSTSSQLAVESDRQKVTWGREDVPGVTAMKVGTVDQTLLTPPGDDTRIDWGYAYAAAAKDQCSAAIGADAALSGAFVQSGKLPASDDANMPRAPRDDQPVMALVFDVGSVGSEPASRHAIVAYDEIYAIRYFGRKLVPYWRRDGATPAELLAAAERDYPKLMKRCEAFDQELMADLTKAGGARYAQIAALSYRQALAACGLAADANKQPLLLTKENTSNGDIATVDVFYPMDPMMILFSPSLAKATLVSNLMYAASPHWKFPNAPHDLGTYPDVFGRDDGGEGMPVEESGNMILLADAICQEEGNADWVKPWWPQLTQWAKYLENYGLDPEQQLCTDDFMGHLAHNANLSVKAILALAAYGDMCRMNGDQANAKRYADLARVDAQHWIRVSSDGDHSRLAFDKPNTWSQKYNLVWDRILGLNIFPPEVARREIAYYKKVMQRYGVPLDSRTKLTKTDWSVWSATMAEDQADFEKIVSPIWDYLDQTTTRDPLSDSYVTTDVHSGGMHARPVVGGIFIRMLADRATWKKWSSMDHSKVGNWAPLPTPPEVMEIVPTSRQHAVEWHYTEQKPASGWIEPNFDDSGWKTGPGGFGSHGTPGVALHTDWHSDDIWLRRQFTMPDTAVSNLQLIVFHDEDVQIYLNGVLAASQAGFITQYLPMDISASARALLKPGAKVTIAVHCHQTEGGQGVDVGLANVVEH